MLYTILGFVISWMLIAVGVWLVYELIRLNGRVLLRLDFLDERITALASRGASPSAEQAPSRPVELAMGTPAPEIDLLDLAGNGHDLTGFRGRRLLLIFFNPHCGFCTRMADALTELSPEGSGETPMPLLVSTGSREDNQAMVDEYGLRCRVLLQPQMQVATRYGVAGTPAGYLIDEQGLIASRMTVGADALLALARTATPKEGAPAKTKEPAALAARPNQSASAGPNAPAASADQSCGKCKGEKKPCAACAGKATDSAPAEYDLVDLCLSRSLEEIGGELTRRAAHSRRLIVVVRSPERGVMGETEAIGLRKFLRTNPAWLVVHQPGAGRFLVLSRDPHDRKAMPSKLAQAASFARALAVHIGDGAKKATAEQMERRLELCTLCDRRSDDHCSACGCVLTTKASWRTSRCPLGKWPVPDKTEAVAQRENSNPTRGTSSSPAAEAPRIPSGVS